MCGRPRRSTLFPYTTLFRSLAAHAWRATVRRRSVVAAVVFATWAVGIEARLVTLQIYERTEHDSRDRKSTRLNSSHGSISYAVFCLKKKNRSTSSTSACTGL